MSFQKTIVVLANSTKLGGRCIAGMEFDVATGEFGDWIRPVSNRVGGELSESDRTYYGGGEPRVLDVISLDLHERCGKGYQQENYLVDDDFAWEQVGQVNWSHLSRFGPSGTRFGRSTLDGTIRPFDVWTNVGELDRIPVHKASRLDYSLDLIDPFEINMVNVVVYGKPQVRARFRYGGYKYDLVITDPRVRCHMEGRGESYSEDVSPVRLCVSLGEPYQGNVYKLVASVIIPGLTGD